MRHADRINAVASNPSECGRSALFASWARSLTRYKLDPLDDRPPRTLSACELRMSREGVAPLLAAADGALDRLFQAVGGSGACVLFTDRLGVPVDRRGACGDDDDFRGWGLWPGAVWSEESEGTNGIGTCLAEDRALTIQRDQHFYTRNIGLSCAVAPVHDHLGRLAAAIDVSTCRSDLTDGFMRLIGCAVAEAARRVEARHFRNAFPQARIVLAPDTDWGSGALLAIGVNDLVVGASHTARIACGITDDMLGRMLPAQTIFSLRSDGVEDLDAAERGVVQRALARAGGNVSAAAKALGVSRATLHRKIRRAGLGRRALSLP